MNLINKLKRLSVVTKNINTKMKFDKIAPVILCSDTISWARAADLLASGQVIAVPTDTIYGLACSANCPEAIKRLYSIKGRDSAKPVAVCVNNTNDVRKWGEANHISDELLGNLLPGPITVVLEKTKNLDNPYLNPSSSKIGIRIPDNSFINNMTRMFNLPVALTSANFSNEPSTLSIKEFEHLYQYLGAVFDGGLLSQGLEQNRTGSTVVDLSKNGYYDIIRKGISYEKIKIILEEHGLVET